MIEGAASLFLGKKSSSSSLNNNIDSVAQEGPVIGMPSSCFSFKYPSLQDPLDLHEFKGTYKKVHPVFHPPF
jgi:hypothetical protein